MTRVLLGHTPNPVEDDMGKMSKEKIQIIRIRIVQTLIVEPSLTLWR